MRTLIFSGPHKTTPGFKSFAGVYAYPYRIRIRIRISRIRVRIVSVSSSLCFLKISYGILEISNDS